MKTKKGMRAIYLIFMVIMLCIIFIQSVNATSVANNEKALSTYKVTDLSNPISIQDLEEMRASVVENYQSEKNSQTSFAYADPEVPDGAEIVAYGFAIDSQGVPIQYVGIAGDEKSVEIIHKKAQEWRDKSTLEENSESSNKQNTLSSNWIVVGRNTGDCYQDPYGGVTNNFELRKLSNDRDSTKDWFAIRQVFSMEPGIRAYQSSYLNHVGSMTNNWSASTAGNPQLYEWDPLGTITGTHTVSVSITGGTGGASTSWSWSYTQPDVKTVDLSSSNTERAKWSMSFNSDDSKETTGGMKPGSTCSMNQLSSGSGICKILDLKAEGKFYDQLILYHTLSDVWNIYYTY
ncbi:hypothetical protein J2128_000302 [Methanomicrobium sp. W14]|uniref:hypothetical protein n=1 Tax=Methanomicrobium sp. W14 TaxID=2817839 RepID=UPI001AE3A397|nr:hypothetical protein [Methanomicrobium sp. W14]MBP2132381.1 hypothetical protein [Methanomicrobium sp. W14]